MFQTLSKRLPILVVLSIVEPKVKNNMHIESVEIEESMNSWFNPQKKGWLAGDVGHSIRINDQKVVWIFGDSFFGNFENGRLKRDGLHINNCIAIQEGVNDDDLKFYMGDVKNTRAFFPHPGNSFPGSFLWPTNGFFLEGILYIVCQSMDIDDTGFWTMSGTLLIEITNPDDNPNNWIKNYYDFNTKPWVGDSFQRQFHSAIFLKDPYIFFKGFNLENGIKKATLSRISMEKFKKFKSSKYLEHLIESNGKDQWSSTDSELKYLYEPGNTESSIQYLQDFGIYVSTTYSALDQNILITYADNLEGPWSNPKVVYENPIKVCPDKTCIETYAVRLHPTFSEKTNELIISYITSYQGEFNNISIEQYRPRFIKVKFKLND